MPAPSPKEQVAKACADMIAVKVKVGLHPTQAKLVALRQIARDAFNGQLDPDAVQQLIITEEIAAGSTRELATKTATDAIESGNGQFASRVIGSPRRKRYRQPSLERPVYDAEADARSAELSAWANGQIEMR